MKYHRLLNSLRNQLFLQIQDATFDPSAFKWEEVASLQSGTLMVPRLTHVPSSGYFHFDLVKSNHWCQFSPGEMTMTEIQFPGSWEYLVAYFRQWLQHLRREIESPDLWAAISGESAMMFGSRVVGDADNALLVPQSGNA